MSLFLNPVFESPGNSFWASENSNAVVNGNLTVNGDVILNSSGDDLICRVQGTLGGETCIQFNKVNGNTARWAIGTQTVEGGANSGNDFRIFSYSDTGAFLSAPLAIDRSDGTVTIIGAAAVGTQMNVGLQTGTGTINVVGPSGAGQVFDAIYNRPGPVDYTQSFTGVVLGGLANPIVTGAYQSGSTFTPTKTGMYLLEGVIGASGSTWTAALGDKIQLVLVPTPAVPGVLPASCGVIMMSSGTGFTSWTSMSCDKLVAGVTYTITADVENNSTTLANNNDEITFDFYITQLC